MQTWDEDSCVLQQRINYNHLLNSGGIQLKLSPSSLPPSFVIHESDTNKNMPPVYATVNKGNERKNLPLLLNSSFRGGGHVPSKERKKSVTIDDNIMTNAIDNKSNKKDPMYVSLKNKKWICYQRINNELLLLQINESKQKWGKVLFCVQIFHRLYLFLFNFSQKLWVYFILTWLFVHCEIETSIILDIETSKVINQIE